MQAAPPTEKAAPASSVAPALGQLEETAALAAERGARARARLQANAVRIASLVIVLFAWTYPMSAHVVFAPAMQPRPSRQARPAAIQVSARYR